MTYKTTLIILPLLSLFLVSTIPYLLLSSILQILPLLFLCLLSNKFYKCENIALDDILRAIILTFRIIYSSIHFIVNDIAMYFMTQCNYILCVCVTFSVSISFEYKILHSNYHNSSLR